MNKNDFIIDINKSSLKHPHHLNSEKSQTSPKNKTYIKILKCKIEAGVAISYFHLLSSLTLTLFNRILFKKYKMKYNFTLLFFQQFVFALFVIFILKSNKYTSTIGEISFTDYYNLRSKYLFFSLLFAVNRLLSFKSNQMVKSIVMFLLLRKFNLIMNYLYDKIINKKNLPQHFRFSVFCITFGTFITGINDFNTDYFGYLYVFIFNILNLIYGQYSEKFRKITNISNIKLLIYNSFTLAPLLLIIIFINGELKAFLFYVFNNEYTWIISFFGLLFISCILCVILNLSFMCSIEKTSSLFNQIIGSFDILISPITSIILQENAINFRTIIGIGISLCGVLGFHYKTMKENIEFEFHKKEKEKVEDSIIIVNNRNNYNKDDFDNIELSYKFKYYEDYYNKTIKI